MKGRFEIIFPSAITFRAALRDGDRGYETLTEVKEYLQRCYPNLGIDDLEWSVEGPSPPDYYELKIKTPLPEGTRKLGKEIQEKVNIFLRTRG